MVRRSTPIDREYRAPRLPHEVSEEGSILTHVAEDVATTVDPYQTWRLTLGLQRSVGADADGGELFSGYLHVEDVDGYGCNVCVTARDPAISDASSRPQVVEAAQVLSRGSPNRSRDLGVQPRRDVRFHRVCRERRFDSFANKIVTKLIPAAVAAKIAT